MARCDASDGESDIFAHHQGDPDMDTIDYTDATFRTCDLPDIVNIYNESPEKAKEIIKNAFQYSLEQRGPTYQVSLDLSDQILEAILRWMPNQDMLLLYTRWAKKQPEHFHSDSISVVRCLAASLHFPLYNDEWSVLNSMTIRYFPFVKGKNQKPHKFFEIR